MSGKRRSQWPRGLGFGSAVARLEYRLGHGYLSVLSVVCCQIEVSASGWSLALRSRTECGREASTGSRLLPTRGCCAMWGVGSEW